MNRFVVAALGATVTGLSIGTAAAADMPVKAPPAPILYNWTGCYIGGHAGGAWARTEWTEVFNTTDFADFDQGQGFSRTESGFIGGGQLGCNYQTGPWVFGIEGTFAGTSIKNTFTSVSVVNVDDAVFETKIQSVATVTGRIGYAWDNWLLYGKGGWGGADVKFSVSDPTDSIFASRTEWHNGWTAGIGVEYGWTPNWIIGLEYDHIGLESRDHDFNGVAVVTANAIAGGGGGGGTVTTPGVLIFDGKPRIDQVVARLSYKFW
jgi:outer membrane immunogenic protein